MSGKCNPNQFIIQLIVHVLYCVQVPQIWLLSLGSLSASSPDSPLSLRADSPAHGCTTRQRLPTRPPLSPQACLWAVPITTHTCPHHTQAPLRARVDHSRAAAPPISTMGPPLAPTNSLWYLGAIAHPPGCCPPALVPPRVLRWSMPVFLCRLMEGAVWMRTAATATLQLYSIQQGGWMKECGDHIDGIRNKTKNLDHVPVRQVNSNPDTWF